MIGSNWFSKQRRPKPNSYNTKFKNGKHTSVVSLDTDNDGQRRTTTDNNGESLGNSYADHALPRWCVPLCVSTPPPRFRRGAIDHRLFHDGFEYVLSACSLLLDESDRCPPSATAEIALAGRFRCPSFLWAPCQSQGLWLNAFHCITPL